MRSRLAVLLMVVATRLLMACGGSGSFTLAIPDPDWTRSGSNPIISPVEGWEGPAVQESSVMYDGGLFKMWYRGGWGAPQSIGYATSTDGIAWTKYASNPVYGDGGGGEASSVALPFVIKVGATFYLYGVAAPFLGAGDDSAVVATSTDGIAWTTQASTMARPSGQDMWGNTRIWIEGGTWYRFMEAQRVTAAGTVWQVWLYTSADGLAWTIANGGSPVSGLQQAAGAAYSVPQMAAGQEIIGGRYRAWFHASPVAGVDYVYIYHATSPDRINWTVVSPAPELTPAGGSEGTSIGDPHILEVAGTTYLYYDGGNPTSGPAYLFVATYPGTIAQLCSWD